MDLGLRFDGPPLNLDPRTARVAAAVDAALDRLDLRDRGVLLRVRDVEELLALSESVVVELILSRRLESVKIGRARRVPVTAVVDYVARLIAEHSE